MRGILYRRDATNYCPGCGRTQWLVGRRSAECVFCATALDLDNGYRKANIAPTVLPR